MNISIWSEEQTPRLLKATDIPAGVGVSSSNRENKKENIPERKNRRRAHVVLCCVCAVPSRLSEKTRDEESTWLTRPCVGSDHIMPATY